jgi:hypothetical protein
MREDGVDGDFSTLGKAIEGDFCGVPWWLAVLSVSGSVLGKKCDEFSFKSREICLVCCLSVELLQLLKEFETLP